MKQTLQQDSLPELQDFHVRLGVFDGPFDLLLSLIAKHELDITEVALSRVTDEFIAYVQELSGSVGMNRLSEFLVVAATLLDMKIVSLLPHSEAVDEQDIALLEARDLLFARLLQYRAFKEASKFFAERFLQEQGRLPRRVPLEQRFREPSRELVWRTSVTEFALLAAAALLPRQEPEVGLTHLHAPTVSIRQQAALVVSLLRSKKQLSFQELISDNPPKNVVIARFLVILELYRRDLLGFTQEDALGDFILSWRGAVWREADLATLGSDYDG